MRERRFQLQQSDPGPKHRMRETDQNPRNKTVGNNGTSMTNAQRATEHPNKTDQRERYKEQKGNLYDELPNY